MTLPLKISEQAKLPLRPTSGELPIPPNPPPALPSTPEPSNSEHPAVARTWNAYCSHVREYFFDADLEAVAIVMASAAAHFHKDSYPVWLFVIGPSSGDKTSVIINSLLSLPEVHMKGELTGKTFLSGYTGTANPSLLHQIGGSGILAFKDFTTFVSKRNEEQGEIAAQLREIADGSFRKDTGKGIPLEWSGKLTVIAAATPALERHWGGRRDLGERFVQVRIGGKDGMQQSLYAQRQRGKEKFITETMKRLAKEFFQCVSPKIANPPPDLSDPQAVRVAAMSQFVSACRGHVPRDARTNVIIGLSEIEGTARISKSFSTLISNHAALFRRERVEEADMRIGLRVALNSIPINRSIVMNNIPLNHGVESTTLTKACGLPDSTVKFHLADLEALGVIRVQHNDIIPNMITLAPEMRRLWNQGFNPLEAAGPLEGEVAH